MVIVYLVVLSESLVVRQQSEGYLLPQMLPVMLHGKFLVPKYVLEQVHEILVMDSLLVVLLLQEHIIQQLVEVPLYLLQQE